MKERLNFKGTEFRGTLLEILEQGKLEVTATENLLEAHDWLRKQLLEKGNIFPVRKFGQSGYYDNHVEAMLPNLEKYRLCIVLRHVQKTRVAR